MLLLMVILELLYIPLYILYCIKDFSIISIKVLQRYVKAYLSVLYLILIFSKTLSLIICQRCWLYCLFELIKFGFLAHLALLACDKDVDWSFYYLFG